MLTRFTLFTCYLLHAEKCICYILYIYIGCPILKVAPKFLQRSSFRKNVSDKGYLGGHKRIHFSMPLENFILW